MLPAGVPPAAEVPRITLPTSAAVAPVTVAPEAYAENQTPATRKKSGPFPGWWPIALAGIAVVLVGVWGFFSFFDSSSAQQPTEAPPVEAMVAVAAEPTATPSPTLRVEPEPSATPGQNEFAAPTDTPSPEPPTATFTLEPTAIPTLSDTPSPTAAGTSTPEPTTVPTFTLTPEPVATPAPLPTATPAVALAGPLTREQLTGKILFKTDRAGRVEIYQMDANGTNQRPLPFENWSIYTQIENELPFSSNRQEQIVVRGEGQLDLWRANVVSGQELRITSTGKPEYDPAWSPVDNRIAYVSEETGNGDIYVLNLDGSAVERLTVNTDNFDKHPTWSPDGSRIAFWSDMGFNKTRQIWVIDLATKTLTSLSDNPFNDWDPVWVH
jgi:hypothetical protein